MEQKLTSDKIVSILVPALLATIISLLGWMGNSLNEISESLAVVTYRIHNHDERITSLEVWRRDNGPTLRRARP